MNYLFTTLVSMVLITLAQANQSVSAAEKSFPHKIVHPTGFQPEGSTIGKGTTAFSGALNGTIYKLDLRAGDGEILIEGEVQQDPPSPDVVNILGMRVDLYRSAYSIHDLQTGLYHVVDRRFDQQTEKYLFVDSRS